MKHRLRFVLGLTLIVAVARLASAQALGETSEFNGQFPVVSGKGALTITGGGYWHRQMYEDGEVPYLSAYDSSEQQLPDGMYRYQFRSIPAGGASSSRQQAMLRGDDPPPSRGKPQAATVISGSFEVSGGQITYR